MKQSPVERVISSIGWLLVILAGVIISSWSLYSLAREGRLPVGIAALTGLTYDGLAFVSSAQAMAWGRVPNAYGIGSRLAMVAAAGLSAYLNYQHGEEMGVSLPVSLMLASAPIAGLWALENHVRFLARGSAKRLPLPKPEMIVWLLFPIRAWKLLRAAVETRLEDYKAVRLTNTSTETVRDWLRSNGYQVGYSGPIPADLRQIYAKATSNGGLNGN